MSHDITAIKKVRSKSVELAYLSISGGNRMLQTFLYESLDAQQYNNLASGCGDNITFTRSGIERARQKLDYLNSEDVLSFAKQGRNMVDELIKLLTGADVLGNGQFVNPPANLILPPAPVQEEQYERAREFFDEILADGAEVIEIGFW